jgi:WD40 repeat protein/predicted Ser/Thr protein kinase
MSEPPDDRVQNLFDQTVVLPAAQRPAFLQAACADDNALRAEVESLLASDADFPDDKGEGLLKSPLLRTLCPTVLAPGSALPAQTNLRLPDHIGRYRVLRLLGEGGMGAVYEAEQDSPHRAVALKVIRPGLLAPALVKRFAHEVEILGRLHHPGIAQIYDAGVAEDGQPFFAMEFIHGRPLDEYARLRSLTVQARAELLARVCDAVQHAHDQGVIHRDLKPANILVEESGQPKVLDFGVARATDADLLTGAGLTLTGQLLGTPSYMSPEQVGADPAAIDHRADVYALGVILFELLAHRLPLQLANRPLAETARLIQEQEPPRLGSINPELRGDVETIVAKALDKDRTRRYATAADLGTDLRHWLAHEPIQARPPSALYHLRKFARRHKALVGGVLATGLALVLGLIGTILFAVGESWQRGQAEHNARVANDEKREARFQTYRARLAAAVAALAMHDVADAARQLDEAPEELRDWEWRHLNSRLDDSFSVISLPVPKMPVPQIGGLVRTPKGLEVASLTSNGLRLMDLVSGKYRTIPIDTKRHRFVSATQTSLGLRVAVRIGKTTTELLDEAGKVLCRIETPKLTEAGQVAVSADGKRLACSFHEGEWGRVPVWGRVAVYDASSGKRTVVCDGHREGLWGFTFNPDGTQLATAGEDRTARLWDAASGTLLATCEGHKDKVLNVAFSPNGARLVTTSTDGTVRQWDTGKGQEIGVPYDRHSGEVTAATYSLDGERIASAGTDRTIRVWHAKTRQDAAILHGHTGAVAGVAFVPGSGQLASLSCPSFSMPGFTWDSTVRVWEVGAGATLPVLRQHDSYVYPVAFSADGRWIASGSWDGTVCLWDAATGEPCASLPHPGVVPSLAFSPKRPWLVTGTYADNWLRIWDLETAQVRKLSKVQAGVVRHLAVSPDGTRVAATASIPQNGKFQMHVYDMTSGKILFSADGSALAYSPDGRWLAVRAEDEKKLLLLNAQTHEEAAHFQGHDKFVYSATFSPDSSRLASCSQDGTVRLWQIGSDAWQELPGHTDEVFAVAFHPDGTRLATGGRDQAIWLWDVARGEVLARLPGHTSYVWSLAFSRDGATLVSGSGDHTVRLWDTAPLKTRYKARHAAAALRPKAEQLVEVLWQAKKTPAEVLAALRADPTLEESLRHAAVRVALLRAWPLKVDPGKAHDPS